MSSSLADRIRWILKTRKIGQRELARRSELSEPHVGMILRRLAQNPYADVGGETLAKIAKGGGVRVAWLVSEEGGPEAGDAPRQAPRLSDRPEWTRVREAAVRLREAEDLDEDDINAVGRMPDDEIEFTAELDARAVLKFAAGLRALRRRVGKAR
jgi:transcriptional regulator with XRE-family HTH domain